MDTLIDLSNIYYNEALEYVNDSKISKAVKSLEESLKYYSKDVQSLNLMGLCQYILCNFDKAYFYWSKSLECSTQNNRAEHYLDYLCSHEFQTVIAEYNLAIDSISRDEYENAINILCEINKVNEELIEPYVIIGLCYYELENHKLAKSYIKKAVREDRDNIQYLRYLNMVNSGDMENKRKSSKGNNILNYILSLLLIVTIVLFSKKHKDYAQLLDKSLGYEETIVHINSELKDIQTNNNVLKRELERERQKEDMLDDNEIDGKDTELTSKDLGKDFTQLFNGAILDIKEQKYSEAVEVLQYIADRSDEHSLVAESTYFLAVCFERMEDFPMAGKYYEIYINKFIGENYYDDSLYNYGLLLYSQGDKGKAKQVLYELKQNVPDSIFVNSKVEYILSQEDGE